MKSNQIKRNKKITIKTARSISLFGIRRTKAERHYTSKLSGSGTIRSGCQLGVLRELEAHQDPHINIIERYAFLPGWPQYNPMRWRPLFLHKSLSNKDWKWARITRLNAKVLLCTWQQKCQSWVMLSSPAFASKLACIHLSKMGCVALTLMKKTPPRRALIG